MYAVQGDVPGRGTIAQDLNPSQYDAFFLSSEYFADQALQRIRKLLPQTDAFSTPLMVFT